MPIYEYYCPDNHTIYQFYAKTLAQGQTTPRCPDNPAFQLKKLVSGFAITRGAKGDAPATGAPAAAGDSPEDLRADAAMAAMEQEVAHIDENDPKAMGRIMRRMSEITGEKLEGQFEEVVRRLEEGTDPEAIDETLGTGEAQEDSGDPFGGGMGTDPGMGAEEAAEPKEPRYRFRARHDAPRRDPKLYDYE